jgi:hypothetical protein
MLLPPPDAPPAVELDEPAVAAMLALVRRARAAVEVGLVEQAADAPPAPPQCPRTTE